MALDPFEVRGRSATFKKVRSSFKERGVLNTNPSVVFPGGEVSGEPVNGIFRVR